MNNLKKLITDLSNYWDLSPEKVVDRLNHMNESEIKNVVNKMTKKFEKGGLLPKAKFEDGGIIKCLKGGKTYAECKKCGGRMIEKGQSGIPDLRQRGSTPAYNESYPKFDETDST